MMGRPHALAGVNTLWLLTVVPDGVTPSNIALPLLRVIAAVMGRGGEE